jgi:hypothetical protein
MSRFQLLLVVDYLLLVIVGVRVSVGHYVGLEQAVTAALTAALVYVTGACAFYLPDCYGLESVFGRTYEFCLLFP